MDLRTHAAVLSRFRWLIALSVLLGTVLATLAVFQISPSGDPIVQFRKKVVWSSTSTLYITQPGFPEGRILANEGAEPGAPTTAEKGAPRFADMQRFSALAVTYSYLLMSDEVRKTIGPLPAGAEIINTAVSEGSGSSKEVLPLISIEGRALDPKVAQAINHKAINALTEFVSTRQLKNGIPERERVQIIAITPPSPATVAVPRSYTAGIVLWILCVMLGVGLAYLLENLRRQPSFAVLPHDSGHDAGTVGFDDEPEPPLDPWALAMPEGKASPEHEHSFRDR